MTETTGKEMKQCRICKSDGLVEVLDLGNIAVSDFVDGSASLYSPLTLMLCDPGMGGCSFVQLKHRAIDSDVLYRRYWYRSGVNESMRTALADITASAQAACPPDAGDIVVDIGANDGTLLRSYPSDLVRVGFEPAENLRAEAETGSDLIIPDFFSADALASHFGPAVRAKLITSIAMFYDLEDPHDFVRDVARILAPDGLWIIQMAYLGTMCSNNNFDNICHEHVGYYSFSVLDSLVRSHDLEIVDVELNDVNGGSFRVYIRHSGAPSHRAPGQSTPRQSTPGQAERVASLKRMERSLGLAETETYQNFGRRIARIKDELRCFVLEELARGKVFHVYGPSTKGNTILQYLELDHRHFAMAADRSPYKWGRRTVATGIPIVSEEMSREARPDYFFVLPCHFRESFISREREFLDAGGRMIFPLPEPSVVRVTGGALEEVPLRDCTPMEVRRHGHE